jgi:hypothetical protein
MYGFCVVCLYSIGKSKNLVFLYLLQTICIHFVWGAVDINSKLRKILNNIQLALRLLMWGYEIKCYKGEVCKLRNIKWRFCSMHSENCY